MPTHGGNPTAGLLPRICACEQEYQPYRAYLLQFQNVLQFQKER